MCSRGYDSIWSLLGRPFIFVPTSVLSEHAAKPGDETVSGQDEISKNPEIHSLSSTLSSDIQSHSDVKPQFIPKVSYYTNQVNDMQMRMDGLLTTSGDRTVDKVRQRKARRSNAKQVLKAEDIPEYRGQMPVDDLVNFINGTTNKRNSTKKKDLKEIIKTENSNNKKIKNRQHVETKTEPEMAHREIGDDLEKVKCEKEMEVSSVGVNQTTDLELDPLGCDASLAHGSWMDFTIVSRKKKGRTRLNVENDQREENVGLEATETRAGMEFNKSVKQFAQLNPDVCKQVSISRKMLNHNSLDVASPKTSEIGNVKCAWEQISNKSHMLNDHVTAEKQKQDTKSSGNCRSPEILRNGDTDHMTRKRPGQRSCLENSPSANINKVAKSKGLFPPVVFADRKQTDYEDIGVSFGFELTGDTDVPVKNENCCYPTVTSHRKAGFLGDHPGTNSLSCASTSCCRGNCSFRLPNTEVRDCSCGHVQTESTLPATAHAQSTKAIQENISNKAAEAEKPGLDEQNKVTRIVNKVEKTNTAPHQEAATDVKVGYVKISDDLKVNCDSCRNKNFTNSTEGKSETTSLAFTALSHSCAGRPVSVVTPNQPVKNSGHDLCSENNSHLISLPNICSSSGHRSGLGQSSSLIPNPCSSQSSCSKLSHGSCQSFCSSSVPALCARAPVLKVAPMLMEKSTTEESSEQEADQLPSKSNNGKELQSEAEIASNTVQHNNKIHGENLSVKVTQSDSILESEQRIHSLNGGQEQCCAILNNTILKEQNAAQKLEPVASKDDPCLYKQHRHCCCEVSHCSKHQEFCSCHISHEPCSYEHENTDVDDEEFQETILDLTPTTFSLFHAQIFLYKSFTDCLLGPYTTLDDLTHDDHEEEY